MVVTFGMYKVDVDIVKTKLFYEGAKAVSKTCPCDDCLNYEKAIEKLPKIVKSFFTNLGIDMKAVCECYVYCQNDNGTLLYGGFYHICGSMLEGESAWEKTSNTNAYWDDGKTFAVSPDFHISFHEDISLLEDNFPSPAIQLEFLASIPWVLEKNNEYV